LISSDYKNDYLNVIWFNNRKSLLYQYYN
jgi:hypothetical protein